jgi:hypothetical protein
MTQAETAIARIEPEGGAGIQQFMPALSVEEAVERRNMLTQYVRRCLTPDVDFGTIPGAGNKSTLLKPGAEKLCTIFGLSKHFDIVERIEDWSGEAHGGEPFFYYLYRCRLTRGDFLIAEADGSCNSRESKYRYRKGERTCPSCSGAFIIKGKAEYGGGWVCFKKKGGCGAQYQDGDPAIESQQAGRVVNPDICDSVNTIQKMAAKRALVAATLLAVNASEFFTQDVEDGVIDAQPVNVTPHQQRPPQQRRQGGQQQQAHAAAAPDPNWQQMIARVEDMFRELNSRGYTPKWTASTIKLYVNDKYITQDGLDGLSASDLQDLQRDLSSKLDALLVAAEQS